MSYRNMNVAELLIEWRKIVNDNVQQGRDGAMLKKFMAETGLKPTQILLGMYSYRGNDTISVLRFIQNKDSWVNDYEWEAELELACLVSHNIPQDYLLYHDLRDEDDTPDRRYHMSNVVSSLSVWKERILA